MLDLAGKTVLVLGLGVSGRSASAFCAARGAAVVAADERPAAALGDLSELPDEVELALGRPFPDPAKFDLVVPSPGVAPGRYARARRSWGDLELAYRALSVPIAAITGTNGKSTVTLLLEAVLRAAALRAEAAGNVGRPALDLVGRALDVAILEVSSFQLEAVECFRPRVAVVLNATPDHLDRHGSFQAYLEAKARILAAQGPDDVAVLNRDDPAVWSLAQRAPGQVHAFSRRGAVERGAYLDAGGIVAVGAETPVRIPVEEIGLAGIHNLENALAAVAAAAALGADVAKGARALRGFAGLPHRRELVRQVGGVTWFNDSKATNLGAVRGALESFATPVVWIAGGRDKGLDFAPLADSAKGRVRAALLIGEAAPAFERALAGRVATERADSLEAAVARAAQLAQPGDVVLLSPGCASFDQFQSFEERGERFRAAVQTLPERGEAR